EIVGISLPGVLRTGRLVWWQPDPGGGRVAGVTEPVAVGVGLAGVGDGGAVVGELVDAVAVGVTVGGRVAGVTAAVVVGVGLPGVGDVGAVVGELVDAVAVGVTVGRRVAGVTGTVAVGVGLPGVGD